MSKLHPHYQAAAEIDPDISRTDMRFSDAFSGARAPTDPWIELARDARAIEEQVFGKAAEAEPSDDVKPRFSTTWEDLQSDLVSGAGVPPTDVVTAERTGLGVLGDAQTARRLCVGIEGIGALATYLFGNHGMHS